MVSVHLSGTSILIIFIDIVLKTLASKNRIKLLFICLGNICRSCTAEEIFRTLAQRAGHGDDYHVDSAGIIDYHEGELPDPRMRQTALRHGYRLTHRSRPIRTAD